ncbi:MAG: signal peptidase II [Nitrospiraceae bacterium]|nr:signal peptidase II [Nitrospiraceae bacterium]
MIMWALSIILVGLDQASKYIAHRLVGPDDSARLTSFLNIVHLNNPGAAFGILQHVGNIFFIIVSVAAIAVVIVILAKSQKKPVGLVLVLSGAAGNLVDRLALGHVRDFIDVHAGSHHWPAFNFADSYLSIGIALLLISSFLKTKDGQE